MRSHSNPLQQRIHVPHSTTRLVSLFFSTSTQASCLLLSNTPRESPTEDNIPQPLPPPLRRPVLILTMTGCQVRLVPDSRRPALDTPLHVGAIREPVPRPSCGLLSPTPLPGIRIALADDPPHRARVREHQTRSTRNLFAAMAIACACARAHTSAACPTAVRAAGGVCSPLRGPPPTFARHNGEPRADRGQAN